MKTKNINTIHICSKEKELNEMHENLSLIQKDVSYLRESFDKEIKMISKTIYGNGNKGLMQRTDELEKYTDTQKGQFGLMKFLVGGGVLISVISIVIAIVI